jgi:beta-ureidopropionase / N-carbamoyl-L-amino-acid hydrolase
MESSVSFEEMWRDLAPVGRSAATGGYFRQPFASAERECRAWFLEQCAVRGLSVEEDGFGNAIAWWSERSEEVEEPFDGAQEPPRSLRSGVSKPRADGILTGSHLDSVLDGGAYDGPLGVASALAAIDVLRDRGFTPARPIGVGVFAEEEGSRFGLACLGSRLATGATSWEVARELTDRDGVRLGDVTGEPERNLLENVGCFAELHVEQGRDLVDRDEAVGVASAIWPHGRYRFDFAGEANHAGTTRMEDRRDPMLTYAMTALAANKQARLAGQRATFGRVDVRPNGTNAVPSAVTAWLDARASSDEELSSMLATIERQSLERAERDGTTVSVTAESVTPEVVFDPTLAKRLAGDRPIIPTAAGHDAGILSQSGIPTAMLFVRNPTGVSHSPDEYAEMADCLSGVEALADALEELAG